MNSQKKIKSIGAVLLFLLLCFGVNSCKKSNSDNAAGKGGTAKVIINMLGVGTNSEPLAALANQQATQAVSPQGVQSQVVSFSKNISVVATLVPKGAPAEGETKGVLSTGGSISPVKKTDAAIVTPLGTNIKYVVMVYDDNGNWVATNNYTKGQEASVTPFKLDAGKTYTFVAFSRNTGTIPATVNTSLLSTASAQQFGDPMYFKKVLTLTSGENDLDIILKHEVTLITVNLTVDPTIIGNLTAIGIGGLGPTYVATDIALIDGSLTYGYGGGLGTYHAVNFGTLPAGGVRSLTSSPMITIYPAGTAGFFNIPSITIDGVTKFNLAFNNLTITPGVEYNLNINFKAPCTTDVLPNTGDGTFSLSQPTGSTTPNIKVLQFSNSADFGFELDLTSLNSSFRLNVNATEFATDIPGSLDDIHNEIQFRGAGRNIKFADGSFWGDGTVSDIGLITGTVANPTVRVVISAAGQVSMYGHKTSTGPLLPLVLINGFSFNTIPWHASGLLNSVILQQAQATAVNTQSSASGRGVAKQTTPCPTP